VLSLAGDHAEALSALLIDPGSTFFPEEFSRELLQQLSRGGHIIADGLDELVEIRERYWRARGETPMVITITTTMNCNLGCYYCYEERSPDRLDAHDLDALLKLVNKRLEESGKRSLHVDWYGGEPLLNLEFLEIASAALQQLCRERGVLYVASIISNGTKWPDDVAGFISRHKIRQVQISFDGLKANHDKRRRYRKGFSDGSESAFDHAVVLVDKLVQCTRTDLRFNIDRGNRGDLLSFIDFAEARGWFAAPFPAVFQPARLASYSASSSFMRASELSLEEFDSLRQQVREHINGAAKIEESEVPDGFPHPKTSVCAALADNSVVVGADGLTYRCGLQVGEVRRAVGSVADSGADNPREGTDAEWWRAFDPTSLPSCSSCSFLPICWGGCPKKHLEGDEYAIREQGRYWRTNLPRLIAKAAGFASVVSPVIPESQQFR
jgi:uncharacterized protein